MINRNWILVGAVIALIVLMWFTWGDAEAADHTTQGNRQYIERVHGYAHGNSLGIQALRRTTNSIEAVNKQQDSAIASKVSQSEFKTDQARQDARANQTDLEVSGVKQVNTRQDETLSSHGNRLDGHDAQFAHMNTALDTRLGGAYQRLDQHSAQIARLERQSERSYEANAIALAVAGHQFNTQGGFQTAISGSTMNGKQALAIGAGGAITDNVFLNVGVARSGSSTGGVVSSTFAW